jgi:hypothetical protein
MSDDTLDPRNPLIAEIKKHLLEALDNDPTEGATSWLSEEQVLQRLNVESCPEWLRVLNREAVRQVYAEHATVGTAPRRSR